MSTWPSIALARRHDEARRLPFEIDTPHGPVPVSYTHLTLPTIYSV